MTVAVIVGVAVPIGFIGFGATIAHIKSLVVYRMRDLFRHVRLPLEAEIQGQSF